MSRRALFGDIAHVLMDREWSDANELAKALADLLSSDAPIVANAPIQITNRTNTDVIQIRNVGRDDWHGVSITDSSGRVAKVGIGLGSQGLVANEVVSDRNFIVDQNIAQKRYDGEVVGSGFGQGLSGSGKFVAHRKYLEVEKVNKKCKAVALPYASTLTFKAGLGGYQYTTLSGDVTLSIDSTQMETGQTVQWEVIDTAGGRTITINVTGGGSLVWDGGSAPAALAAGKARLYTFTKNSVGNITAGVAYLSY